MRRPGGSITADLSDTLKNTMEYFTPEDQEEDDTDNHKQARIQSQELVDSADVKQLTLEENR